MILKPRFLNTLGWGEASIHGVEMEKRWQGFFFLWFHGSYIVPHTKIQRIYEVYLLVVKLLERFFFFQIFSWGFRYRWVKADEFHGKYKTNILSWNFSWLFSLLAHLNLLKFRFGTLHFICGLFALINRVDICVARIEILNFLKYGEVSPCYHILTKPSAVSLTLLRKELLGTEWDVKQKKVFAGFVH